MPSSSAARQRSVTSPIGSDAAVSRNACVAAGSDSRRRRKLCSMRLARGCASGRPNPPASSTAVSPRGSSSRASGLPRVSAMIRSRTRSSNGPGVTSSRSALASLSCRPRTTISGRSTSSCSSLGSRTTNTRATDSARSRRATKASACAEARSNHCASSTRHTSGCSWATSDNSPSSARPTRKRSGATPPSRPSAVLIAACCGSGRCVRLPSSGMQSWCSPAKASSISDSTPAAPSTRHPDARAST
jgi:hypothetical protein